MLHDISYTNIIMYCAVLPSYDSKSAKDKSNDKKINADDPRNKAEVHKIMFG